MKVALVHDYIKEFGGAEKVLETLHEIYPEAPIYTSMYLPKFLGPHRSRFKKYNIKTTVLQYLPFKSKLISPARLLIPFIFSHLNFSKYDVVIVSATGAYTPNVIQKGKARHIVYCHTPPRYLYGYMTARNWKNNPVLRVLGRVANHFLRIIDYNSSQEPDFFIANSQEVARRIKKFYRRDSIVINPPIDIPNIGKLVPMKNRKYYVAGGRWARAKRIDLAIKAANEMKLPLKVFGRGFAGYDKVLRQIAGPTIEFVGEVTDKQKWELLKSAKAYISPSVGEDFGMLNVEAMACGTPVIGHNSGGTKETVIDGNLPAQAGTGILFDKTTTKSLIDAIEKLEKLNISPNNCRKHAKKFSKERFEKGMKEFVREVV